MTSDGIYWIDPNGGSAADAFQVHADMTTAANDVGSSVGLNCAVCFGVPWYYTGCYNAIPVSLVNIIGGPFSRGSQSADEIGSWSVYVREENTPAAVSGPGMLALFGVLLAGLGVARRRNRP